MGQPVFEIYNADGSLQMNLSSRLTKFLGSVGVNLSSDGSLTDQRFTDGTPWYCFLSFSESYRNGGSIPDVTFTGATMSWNRTSFGTAYIPATIIYGIYSNGNN